jgi:hypothetical protein
VTISPEILHYQRFGNGALSKLCGAQIQRSNSMSCARSAKAQGNVKDMRHFVRSARRWHAKTKALAPTVPPAVLAYWRGA